MHWPLFTRLTQIAVLTDENFNDYEILVDETILALNSLNSMIKTEEEQ